ncbi:MAG: hypothetical protein AABW41_04140 [Nanoarchaeota archaeon]
MNKKIIMALLLMAVIFIASCQFEKEAPKVILKSGQEASGAVSNFTDEANSAASSLQEISRSLGK